MRRTRANPWISTALAFLLMVLGSGAENILWAFQIGYMGAILLGLIVILMVDQNELGRRRQVAVVLLSIWSVTFSGTAIPVLLAAGLVSLARRGAVKSLLLLGPSALLYVGWYVIFVRGQASPYSASTINELGVGVPQYLGSFLVDGLGKVLPFPDLGAIALFCLMVWATLTITQWRGVSTAAYALAAAALLQGVLTAYSRLLLGFEAASSSRYVYGLVALLLPAIALAFTWFARHRRSVIAVIVSLVLIVAAYNGVLLRREAAAQSAIERATQQRLYAALDLVLQSDDAIDPNIRPVPIYAPNVSVGDLKEMNARGWISVGPYDIPALLSVQAQLNVTVQRAASAGTVGCETLEVDDTFTGVDGAVLIRLDEPGRVQLSIIDGAAAGDARGVDLTRGWNAIEFPAELTILVSSATATAVACDA